MSASFPETLRGAFPKTINPPHNPLLSMGMLPSRLSPSTVKIMGFVAVPWAISKGYLNKISRINKSGLK